MNKGNRPLAGDEKTKTLTNIILFSYNKYLVVSTGIDSCFSCEIPLSNNYPVLDRDHPPKMPCCLECGGE